MTYLLDTNVLSLLMGSGPEGEVGAWLAATPTNLLFTAAICQAEIFAGVRTMPQGRRRDGIEAAAVALFAIDFVGRVLPFGSAAALAYADIMAARRRLGLGTAPMDMLIAATALAADATVVTRDIRGFEGCGVPIIDPWRAA